MTTSATDSEKLYEAAGTGNIRISVPTTALRIIISHAFKGQNKMKLKIHF
jgi:hypothetical protein